MDPQRLLEQFLGGGGTDRQGFGSRDDGRGSRWEARERGPGSQAQDRGGSWDDARDLAGRFTAGPMGGFGGGMAAGGVLGLLLGGKKVRKMAGGALGYGGAAVLGALAYRAYQNYQQGQAPAQAPAASERDVKDAAAFVPPDAADGRPFALVLVLAMISAAKADGHIGPEEQTAIFEKVEALDLDAESKGFVFDALSRQIPLNEIAGLASGPEQGAEIYLAARLAIDPDHPAEKAYLEALAHRLKLPGELVAHLERQTQALPAPEQG